MIKMFRVLGLVILLNLIPLICLAVTVSYSNDLTVEITYPHDGDRILNSPVLVSGSVSDPSAKITINSAPVVVAENGSFQSSADLAIGENSIIITAEGQSQEYTTKSIFVRYLPKY